LVIRFAALLLSFAIVAGATELGAASHFITLASTTSTENSGLLGHLLPRFLAATGIEVRVVAVGTGQALRIARSGDADVLLVHHRPSEEAFVAEGHGVARHEVMMNDYVIAGPRTDPAGIADVDSAIAALTRIAAAEAPFVSRGDDSGTHKREMALWAVAGFDPLATSRAWYREVGAGMGAALNIAAAMPAYLLSDRGTWISFRNKGELTLLIEGDPPLFNPYGVILVNKARHPHVKAAEGQAFIDWLLSDEGQSAIASFRVDGQQLFFPRAGYAGP
jgi:tungstate transport system substrate-binding protein